MARRGYFRGDLRTGQPVTLVASAYGVAPGDITSEQLETVADLADRYAFGEARSTHEQNIVLASVRRSDLIHSDGHIAVTDFDTAIHLTHSIHQHKDLLMACQGDLAVGINIVYRRRLWQTSQKGRLGK